eukprot:584241_1
MAVPSYFDKSDEQSFEDVANISTSLSPTQKENITSLLHEFSDIAVTSPSQFRPGEVKVEPVDIDVGDSKPISEPPRRYAKPLREVIDKTIKKLLSNKIEIPFKNLKNLKP